MLDAFAIVSRFEKKRQTMDAVYHESLSLCQATSGIDLG